MNESQSRVTDEARYAARHVRWMLFGIGGVYAIAAAGLGTLPAYDVLVSIVLGFAGLLAVLVGASVTVVDDGKAVVVSSSYGHVHRVIGPGPSFVPAVVVDTESIPIGPWEITVQRQGFAPDGEPVTVSVLVDVRMADPERALAEADPRQIASRLVTDALRQGLSDIDRRRLMPEPDRFAGLLQDAVDQEARTHGIEIPSIELTDVKTPGLTG